MEQTDPLTGSAGLFTFNEMRLSLILFLGTLAAAPIGETVERRLAVMGTALDVSVTASSRPEASDATEAAVREIARVEGLLSTWTDRVPLPG